MVIVLAHEEDFRFGFRSSVPAIVSNVWGPRSDTTPWLNSSLFANIQQSSDLVFEMEIDHAAREALERYRQSASGDPTIVSNSFPRMLYLSIVTISTLGFGDIVSISDRARALIGLESVLGIVFAGLFLNATARNPIRARDRGAGSEPSAKVRG
jgi:hypothetical protein